MKKRMYRMFLFPLVIAAILAVVGCGTGSFAEAGEEIIDAEDAIILLQDEDVILVDAQNARTYQKRHLEGAINISRADIVVNTPFVNMLAPAETIEEVFGAKGIANDSSILVYDGNNNMDAARFWWTAKVYGHDQVKVISGGIEALIAAGASLSEEVPRIMAENYEVKPVNPDWIALKSDLIQQVDNPDPGVDIVDTRTQEEYNQGTIPGALCLDYAGNNFSDGTYRPVRHIRIRYQEEDVHPEDTVILFCKTSIRGAQSFLALYNAGYRNLKLYDGAWIEWSSDTDLPVQMPDESRMQPDVQDAS